jgi:anti-anti-sigma factor
VHVVSDQLVTTVEHHDSHTVLRLTGELDLATQGPFRAQAIDLLVAGHVHLVLELSELTFVDSTGLGAFIGLRRRAHALQGSLTLVCPADAVMKVFTIVGLEKVFDIRTDLESALAG